jgi:uncharacterized protein (DUF305 family)
MKKYLSGLTFLFILTSTVFMPARQASAHRDGEQGVGAVWSKLGRDMDKMHAGMRSITPSGNGDVDFVSLMIPHHQAAIDMAKTELEYGKDPQMLRLAQEIVTDQQSEAELMRLWLKQHEPNSQK